ncbi:unnamed protein product [Pleuronectes platessa]|uniref:Uncharacterized protein n=1 Tax=Pleuronectes platessa TaxID=8262 RepID=A0A9N7Y9X1_PLEPL|nr:unnamed protein product [Pleuronectes platessa]
MRALVPLLTRDRGRCQGTCPGLCGVDSRGRAAGDALTGPRSLPAALSDSPAAPGRTVPGRKDSGSPPLQDPLVGSVAPLRPPGERNHEAERAGLPDLG